MAGFLCEAAASSARRQSAQALTYGAKRRNRARGTSRFLWGTLPEETSGVTVYDPEFSEHPADRAATGLNTIFVGLNGSFCLCETSSPIGLNGVKTKVRAPGAPDTAGGK